MTLPEAILSVAIAVAAGGLIGAERQQAHAGEEHEDFGGIRTFPLVALTGACAGLLRQTFGTWAFGALFAGVVSLLAIYVGKTGLYASAVLAGLTDVDAITLSLAELHLAGTSPNVAAIGITLAAATNTLVKVAIAATIGGWALGKRVGISLLAALAVGLAVLAVL